MNNKKYRNNQGMLTVECAVGILVFVFFFLSLASLILFYKAHSELQHTISTTAMEEAVYAGALFSASLNSAPEIIDDVLSDGYTFLKINDSFDKAKGKSVNVLSSPVTPANLILSRDTTEDVDVVLTYKMHPLFNFFGINDKTYVNRAKVHKWIGADIYDGKSDEDRIVYITEHGSVYHVSRTCRYLDLSIRACDGMRIEELRNKSGGKYKPCERCRPDREGCLFITDYGDTYHSTLSCSGLKRSIKAVKLKDVGDMKCCSKCGG